MGRTTAHLRATEAGFSLLEGLIATALLVVGLLAVAQVLAMTVAQHGVGRSTAEATRLAQSKHEELAKLDFATDPSVQVSPLAPDPLTQNVANYFDVPANGVYTRRWRVETGPTATTRFLTVRVEPTDMTRPLARAVDLATVIRQW
jgi:hypothetical protein